MKRQKQYSNIIQAAIEAVGDVQEPYRTLAFPSILEDILSADRLEVQPVSQAKQARQEDTHSAIPFAELLATLKPKDNYEKILAAIYHLEIVDRKSPVTRSEIDAKLWEVREKVDSAHVYLRNLVGPEKAMLVIERKNGRDAYRMLRKGIDFIQARLEARNPSTTVGSDAKVI